MSGEVTNFFSREQFVASSSWTRLVASDKAFSRRSHLSETKRLAHDGAGKTVRSHRESHRWEQDAPLCEGLVGLFHILRQTSEFQLVLQELDLGFVIRLQVSHVPGVLLPQPLPDPESRK